MSDSTTTTRLSRAEVEHILWQVDEHRSGPIYHPGYPNIRRLAVDARVYMTALEDIADGGCDHYTHAAGRVVHKDCPALIAAAALGRLP